MIIPIMGRRKNGLSMTSKKNFYSWKAIFLGFPQFFLNWICSIDCHWILYVCTVFKKAIGGSLFCFQWLPSARKRGSFKGLQVRPLSCSYCLKCWCPWLGHIWCQAFCQLWLAKWDWGHDRTENACTVSTSRCPIQSLRKVF